MKLMTKELEAKIPALYSTESVEMQDKVLIAKFFDPTGSWTWYVAEGRREEGDYLFFGLVDGMEREWGYFSLNELQSVKGRFGLGIERDLYFTPCKVSELRS